MDGTETELIKIRNFLDKLVCMPRVPQVQWDPP